MMDAAPDWQARATGLAFDIRPLIDGRLTDSSSDRYSVINPATEQAITDAPNGNGADVDRAVASARAAFADGRWSEKTPLDRREVLLRLNQLILDHREELALLETLNVGKPITQALGEVDFACEYLRFAAEACDKIADDVLPSARDLLALNLREPVGVVSAILPWNFPMVTAAMKLGPALATGNCVVLKPSEISPLSALRIGMLALEAGVPDGVLNIVPGTGATVGRALAEHHDVDMLTFTGSTATGRTLLEASGRSNLKKLLLECGGKSPHIVFADTADLNAVAADVVEQISWNQGQVCVAGSRLIVARAIQDALVEKVTALMAAIRPGDPLDPATEAGPLASEPHLAKVLGHIAAAQGGGARARTGGARIDRPGFFVQPAVFDGVTPAMALAQEEVFGPVLAVLPFDTADDAVALAHSVNYGLSARVWTSDIAMGYGLSRRLRAGEITINAGIPTGASVGAAAAAEPFGISGFGVEGGLDGLRQYTRRKAIMLNLPQSATMR